MRQRRCMSLRARVVSIALWERSRLFCSVDPSSLLAAGPGISHTTRAPSPGQRAALPGGESRKSRPVKGRAKREPARVTAALDGPGTRRTSSISTTSSERSERPRGHTCALSVGSFCRSRRRCRSVYCRECARENQWCDEGAPPQRAPYKHLSFFNVQTNPLTPIRRRGPACVERYPQRDPPRWAALFNRRAPFRRALLRSRQARIRPALTGVKPGVNPASFPASRRRSILLDSRSGLTYALGTCFDNRTVPHRVNPLGENPGCP